MAFAENRPPKKYLHLVVDHFTRYGFVNPSSTLHAKDVIKILEPIFKNIVFKNYTVKIRIAHQNIGINSHAFKKLLKIHKNTLVFTAILMKGLIKLNK